jgi:hypothetical protein
LYGINNTYFIRIATKIASFWKTAGKDTFLLVYGRKNVEQDLSPGGISLDQSTSI